MTIRRHRGTIKSVFGTVLSIAHLAAEQHVIRIECPEIVDTAHPGNFVHLRCNRELAMRRPMSIMRVSKNQGWFDMLFKTVGLGTDLLSQQSVGDEISVLGPIGVPFKLKDYRKRPMLIGGGVGIPPMIYLAEHIKGRAISSQPIVLMGSEVPFPFQTRPSQIMSTQFPPEVLACMPLLEDWKVLSRLATNQGYSGCFNGFVTDLARYTLNLNRSSLDEFEIFACGPNPMLKAVKALADEFSLPCQISLEEHMACAVGGCAGCAVEIQEGQNIAMKRVCVDGPIFEAETVIFPST
jgi:dihydroorotate dehydrogenase electron transfer subunit